MPVSSGEQWSQERKRCRADFCSDCSLCRKSSAKTCSCQYHKPVSTSKYYMMFALNLDTVDTWHRGFRLPSAKNQGKWMAVTQVEWRSRLLPNHKREASVSVNCFSSSRTSYQAMSVEFLRRHQLGCHLVQPGRAMTWPTNAIRTSSFWLSWYWVHSTHTNTPGALL